MFGSAKKMPASIDDYPRATSTLTQYALDQHMKKTLDSYRIKDGRISSQCSPRLDPFDTERSKAGTTLSLNETLATGFPVRAEKDKVFKKRAY